MVAKDYISAMVNANKIIYIDTASLMDVSELSQFIQNSEDILLNKGRRIIVPQAVCLELVRHLGSTNQEKQDKAMQALELLKEHQGIFEVHNSGLNDEDVYRAFADAEILAELTRNKKDCGQLLITNDRALSQDAFDLNNQGSCRGHRIMVCFINKLGELRKCECTCTDTEEETTAVKSISTVEEPKIAEQTYAEKGAAYLNAEESVHLVTTEDSLSALDVLVPVGTFILGILTCKYGKTAIKLITSII